MPTTRAGASSGGDDDTGIGIDASTSQRSESRLLTYADLELRLAADREHYMQLFRTSRPEAQPDPIHGPINTSGLDQLPGDASLHTFLIWRTQWKDFSASACLPSRPAHIQMATLRRVLSLDMLRTLDNFLGIDAETGLSTNEVLDAIQRLLRSRRSRFVDLTEFFSATQGPQESFEKFYMRIRGLAMAGSIPPALMGDLLITCIIGGIRNKELSKKLLSIRPEPTLEETLSLCSGDEYVERCGTRQTSSFVYKGSEIGKICATSGTTHSVNQK